MSFKRSILAFLVAFLPFIAEAQPFAVLPDIPGVRKGTLPNGIFYYVFQNSSSKGIADFALVQKVGTEDEAPGNGGTVLKQAKSVLSSSERLGGKSPQQLLVSKGAIPQDYGFVKVGKASTIYYFDDVPVLNDKSVTDSTLLVLFDIIDRQAYPSSRQAVIVSGDIVPEALEEKMKMLSLMIPAHPEEAAADTAAVADTSAAAASYELHNLCCGLSSVRIGYTMDRVPAGYMNSVFPAITSKYVRKMGAVLERRTKKMLDASSIPYADVRTSYVSSCEQGGKERFMVEADVLDEDLPEVVKTVASVLYSMNEGGISMEEQKYAAGVFAKDLRAWAINPIVLNSVNVRRAVASFLYGAPLSSPRAEMDFLLSKSISDSLECHLVNNFSKAIIDRSRNLLVSYTSSRYGKDEIEAAFGAGWDAGADIGPDFWSIAGLEKEKPEQVPEKIKVRQTRPEPVTGGKIWTFTNGMKVIYKKMPIGDLMYASLILNRGYASLKNISSGEGALMSDILGLYDIAGISGPDYRDALLAKGLALDFQVRNFSTSLDITAPSDSLGLVMDVLRECTSSYRFNKNSAALYAKSEALRYAALKGTRAERIQIIDSIMCPSYTYSPYRKEGKFNENLLERADRFFQETFSNVDEGILVILSSKEEDVVRKQLCSLLGGFQVSARMFRLPPVSFQPQAGSATYTANGDEFSADIAISARIPLTSENYVLAQLASMILQERLITSLNTSGVNVNVSTAFRKVPQERFNVLISLTSVDEEGYVEGTVNRNIMNVLNRVRSAIRDVPEKEEIERYLPIAKSLLGSRHEHMKTYPDFYIATIRTRYLEGKDLFSRYEAFLKAADADKVAAVYRQMSQGSTVEYVVDNLKK